MDKKLLTDINEYLHRELGSTFDGKPQYRVVWSTGMTEKRFGTFSDFYGKIFVRRVTEVREVLKYPQFQDRWIFERYERRDNPEMIEADGYEPLHVFCDKHGMFLPLNRKVIEYMVAKIKAPYDRSARKAEMEAEDERAQAEEVEEFMAVLENVGRSPLFAYEDSVFLDSTKKKTE